MQATKEVKKEGSVRVDLVGGTLDLPPIHLILKDVVTLNVATSLKARVRLTSMDGDFVEIISSDYNTTTRFYEREFTSENLHSTDYFKEFSFVVQILDLFRAHRNLRVEITSGSPPGAGLGGSSAMGMTLFSALLDYYDGHHSFPRSRVDMIGRVRDIESRILNRGVAGYQDYYPAVFGGVLALHPRIGHVEVEQLYSPELAHYLEKHVTLIYSGQTRKSGINNWEVYKSFFDNKEIVRTGLASIADIAQRAYRAAQKGDYDELLFETAQEGREREKLFPNIVSRDIRELYQDVLNDLPHVGLKVCGAGGGGCFILTHRDVDRERILEKVEKHRMRVLDFSLTGPLSWPGE